MVLMEMEDSRSRSSGFSGAVNAFAKWLAKAEKKRHARALQAIRNPPKPETEPAFWSDVRPVTHKVKTRHGKVI